MEELLGELGNLSAVYHKCVRTLPYLEMVADQSFSNRPVQAFIAGGKLGADQISAQRGDSAGREAAIATLVAGQKAENVSPLSHSSGDWSTETRHAAARL